MTTTQLLRSEIPTFSEKDRKIAKITTVPGEVYFVKAIDVRTSSSPSFDGIFVRRCGGLGYTKAIAGIASVEFLTEAEYLSLFEVEKTIVFVPKYGSTYRGRVEEIGRTRVTVRFLTTGGKAKRFAFPVSDVGICR